MPNHLNLINNFFVDINEKLKGSFLPDFYSVNNFALSMNYLQTDRYLEKSFVYYHTNHRKSIMMKIDEIMRKNKKNKILITGLQGSGKSHFLSHFVLSHRIQGINSKLRILYVNNSAHYLQTSLDYIINELKYMLCCDIVEGDKQFSDFLLEHLILFDKVLHSGKKQLLFDFLVLLKDKLNSRNIKLILIWDQINVLYREPHKYFELLKFFQQISNNFKFFDDVFLSSSNNNLELSDLKNFALSIEFNSFEIFENEELPNLIRFESYCYKPKDIQVEKVGEFSKCLCSFLNNSITEYYYYKKSLWNREEKLSLIPNMMQAEAFSYYLNERSIAIRESERKFRNEYINSPDKMISYYQAINKLLTHQEFQLLGNEEKVINSNFI